MQISCALLNDFVHGAPPGETPLPRCRSLTRALSLQLASPPCATPQSCGRAATTVRQIATYRPPMPTFAKGLRRDGVRDLLLSTLLAPRPAGPPCPIGVRGGLRESPCRRPTTDLMPCPLHPARPTNSVPRMSRTNDHMISSETPLFPLLGAPHCAIRCRTCAGAKCTAPSPSFGPALLVAQSVAVGAPASVPYQLKPPPGEPTGQPSFPCKEIHCKVLSQPSGCPRLERWALMMQVAQSSTFRTKDTAVMDMAVATIFTGAREHSNSAPGDLRCFLEVKEAASVPAVAVQGTS